MNRKKVTAIVFPDEDGGYTAVLPYFSCRLITGDYCLTAQGETAEEALAAARERLEGFLAISGAEGRYHLECGLLAGVEVRELEVEAPEG